VNFTPATANWITAHTEFADLPGKGKGFTRLGPRINLEKAIPRLGKAFVSVGVGYLIQVTGEAHPKSFIASAQSKEVPLGVKATVHLEAFNYRFGSFSYGEAWGVVTVPSWKHIQPVVHTIWDTSRSPVTTVAFGARFTL
jgi:hypothetical protein